MVAEGVVVYRGFDPMAIELAEARLRAAEIPYVRLGRGNAALVGVGSHILEQLIEVPTEHAADARALLTIEPAEGDGDAGSAADDDDRDVESDAPRGQVSLKWRVLALGLSLLFPGLGLAYAGSMITGGILAAWALASLVSVAPDPVAALVFGQAVPRLFDLIASQLWLGRFGRRRPTAVAQCIVALAIIGSLHLARQQLGPSITSWLEQTLVPQPSEE